MPLRLKTAWQTEFTRAQGAGDQFEWQTVCVNSINSPVIGSPGIIARGRDEVQQIYAQTAVMGAKLRTQFVNESASKQTVACHFVSLSPTPPQGFVFSSMRETPGFKWKVLGPAGSAQSTKSVVSKISVASWQNVNKIDILKDEDFKESAAASPNVQKPIYVHIGYGWLTESATGGWSLPVTNTLDQYVVTDKAFPLL